MTAALGRYLLAAVTGVFTAIALSVLCAVLLFWSGAMFYAPDTSFFLAFIGSVAASPFMYLHFKNRAPQHIRTLLVSLTTMWSILLYVCITIAIRVPNAVLFGTTLFR